jgi:PAS domain S-box-containing protein
MENNEKAKDQLIQELIELRRRNVALEKSVTESEQVEKALQESQKTMRALLNAPSDVVLLVNLEGFIVDANETAVKRLGKRLDELIGLCIWDLLPSDLAQRRKAFADQVIQSGMPVRFEDERMGVYFDNVTYPIFDEQGKVTKIAGIARDITERKKSEVALRQSEERYRNILENIEEGYDEVDLKGNITFFNKSFYKHLGYTKEELQGMNYRRYLVQENAQKAFKAYNEVFKTGKPIKSVEWEIIRKDGTKRNIAVSISLIKDASKQPIGFRSIGRDETDRRKVEEALKKSEKNLRLLSNRLMNAQEKERKRIAYELHDELGQSLVGLKFQLRELQKKSIGTPNGFQQEIAQALNTINGMAENIRRISQELRPSVLEHLGLSEALQWLAEDFNRRFRIKVINIVGKIKTKFSKQQEIIIFRVFQEALTNIRKHAEATQVTMAMTESGKNNIFSIQDNGKGFDLKDVGLRAPQKTGLGLIAMRERAAMGGGTIEIKSEPGEGTLITFAIQGRRTQKK